MQKNKEKNVIFTFKFKLQTNYLFGKCQILENYLFGFCHFLRNYLFGKYQITIFAL